MKILLIVPYSNSHYYVPPIGLGYLVTALRKEGIKDVNIIDGEKVSLTPDKFSDLIKTQKPDLVGFQVFSSDVSIVKKYLKILKKNQPKTITTIGGAHVSGVLEEIYLDFPQADYAFRSEAEKGFPLLIKKIMNLQTIDFENIPGLIWKKEKKIIVNPMVLEENLDSLGLPAWDLMDIRTYPQAPQGAIFRNWPIAPILTSRGCPYSCTYCANRLSMGQKIRYRSIKNVMKEVQLLYTKYGARELHIIDDTFTSNRERVMEFCNYLIKNKIKVTIAFPNGVRLNTLDEELLKLMKKAGVYSITLGIESGSEKILKDMKKALTINLIQEKLALIDKIGIDMAGFFIIGYPTETRETILETIKFSKELPLKRAHFSTFLPLPGTDITKQLMKEGKLKKINWDKLFYTEAPFPPKGMTSKDLRKLQKKAFREFYLRPKIIYWMMQDIRSLIHFKSLLKRAWDYTFKP